MPDSTVDRQFLGSIPEMYERYLVPLIFEPYGADLAERVRGRRLDRVLELAAGTGAVTRHLARCLPAACELVATDLQQPMLDQAASVAMSRPVQWRQADAMQLPFPDASFDAVLCQFGVMFFPDKRAAFAEARRVLRPGGVFLFNVWDAIEHNEFADTVTQALAHVFPADPPLFLARTPHGSHDTDALTVDLARAGFARAPEVETVTARSRAPSPNIPAVAYCQGTPLRNEIEARGEGRLVMATDAAMQAIARRFGRGPVDGKIQAHVFTVRNG
ncbi:class I SAM-dependent methyltransferase [Ramlibacter sp. PS3R-8]|uniref:class I SAM-dependent methyltransferase n=1 Tax=Ramlibacter sp. PS3R-8 TaxID=3133437 RepID=UPI0030B56FD0